MASPTCQRLTELASEGVAPALRAVDCVSNEMAASAFGRLFAPGGGLLTALTVLLTLYVAFFAFSLITGRSTLGISALTPRMLTLGLVLTFATSWMAYQGFLWSLVLGGPDWIAGLIMGSKGSATEMFADRIDIVFGVVTQIGESGAAAGGAQDAASKAAGAASVMSPEGVMWMGALLLMLGTVGVLLTARIALAILLALGPIFVIFALFEGTRGLTAGWLRGLVLTAVTPLFVVLGGAITLELMVPIVSGLVQSAQLGELDGRGAMAFFVVAAVHVALMAMVFKVAGTMVGGWQVFGLARDRERSSASHASQAPAPAAAISPQAVAAASESARLRSVAVASSAGMGTPSGPGGGSSAGASGDRRTVVTQVSGGGIEPMRSGQDPRTRGIGSRFRSASNDAGRLPAKEKTR